MAMKTLLLILSCLAVLNVQAERADRDKPVHLEANRVTVDDANKTQILEGNVLLTRGTLTINAERIVVSLDAEGFQKSMAQGGVGGLARFRQKREGRDDYVEGQAERIEYDGKNNLAQLFGHAHIKSGRDEISGDYISYDGYSEKYLARAADKPDGRVRAVIGPKRD